MWFKRHGNVNDLIMSIKRLRFLKWPQHISYRHEYDLAMIVFKSQSIIIPRRIKTVFTHWFGSVIVTLRQMCFLFLYFVTARYFILMSCERESLTVLHRTSTVPLRAAVQSPCHEIEPLKPRCSPPVLTYSSWLTNKSRRRLVATDSLCKHLDFLPGVCAPN